MQHPLIRLEGVAYAYGDHRVLEGIDLAVWAGEQLALLGPNGSGKSTLLGLMTGRLRWQTGLYEFAGRPVWQHPLDWYHNLGVVFQAPSLDRRLTAWDNLVLAAGLRGFGWGERRQRARAGLAEAQLTDAADRPVKDLSGGMRRRLDIARALIHQPRVLLMDEPTTGLDERSRRDFWHRLADRRRQTSLTVVVSTHRADEAESCDRVAIVHRGRLVRLATPEELRQDVSRDILVLDLDDPDEAEALLVERFGVTSRRRPAGLLLECDAAHELVAPIVDALGPGRVKALHIRRPTLADAFLHVTGEDLGASSQETSMVAGGVAA